MNLNEIDIDIVTKGVKTFCYKNDRLTFKSVYSANSLQRSDKWILVLKIDDDEINLKPAAHNGKMQLDFLQTMKKQIGASVVIPGNIFMLKAVRTFHVNLPENIRH